MNREGHRAEDFGTGKTEIGRPDRARKSSLGATERFWRFRHGNYISRRPRTPHSRVNGKSSLLVRAGSPNLSVDTFPLLRTARSFLCPWVGWVWSAAGASSMVLALGHSYRWALRQHKFWPNVPKGSERWFVCLNRDDFLRAVAGTRTINPVPVRYWTDGHFRPLVQQETNLELGRTAFL
jgi:hypothetical protein